MKRILVFSFVILSTLVSAAAFSAAGTTSVSPIASQGETLGEKFVYVDFEKLENGRVVSTGGGLVQIYTAQQLTPVQFKGSANSSPAAPEIIRLKENDQNHLAAFEYTLTSPNQWANVTLEVQGHPMKDGQATPDDVSADKNLSVQLYATGVDYLRVEFISHGQGIKLDNGFPQFAVKLKPGLNTYLIPLKNIAQPSWVQLKVSPKDVLKKLTAISISAYCNQCLPQHGTVIIDNLVFEK